MSDQNVVHPTGPRHGRSAGAIGAGFAAIVVLSLGTDQVLHALDVYPPWGQPMREPALNALALGYRSAYAVVGSYIAARWAPYAPLRHAMALGCVGFALSAIGAIVALTHDLGPAWYPIALVATSLPCAWLGGILRRGTARR